MLPQVGIQSSKCSAVGNHTYKETNENGERLVEFALANNLKIVNTFFQKRSERKWTWIAPIRRTKNEIDHFLINNKEIVKDVSILSRFEFPSDHRIGRGSLQIIRRPRFNDCTYVNEQN